MKKIKAISEGITNTIIKDEKIEELAKERYSICEKCEHNNKEIIERCKICGCIIKFKIRQSIQKCPKKYWKH